MVTACRSKAPVGFLLRVAAFAAGSRIVTYFDNSRRLRPHVQLASSQPQAAHLSGNNCVALCASMAFCIVSNESRGSSALLAQSSRPSSTRVGFRLVVGLRQCCQRVVIKCPGSDLQSQPRAPRLMMTDEGLVGGSQACLRFGC